MSSTIGTYTTIGDLIKKYRGGLSWGELSKLTGIEKSIIRKIENGDTKRPELKTIIPIFKALNAPREEVIETCIMTENRFSVLRELLAEAIRLLSANLIEKATVRLLECPQAKSEEIVEELYHTALSVEDTDVKCLLFNNIVQYCRLRGIQPYTAKALYQKYRIDRTEVSQLEEAYRLGKEVLYYTDFLSQEEKITLYYLMAYDAHDMEKYEECIAYGKTGHAEDPTNNEVKERVALAICNCYFHLGRYDEMEEHIQQYESLGYEFIKVRSKYLRAIILSKKGYYNEAIPLLRECVTEATKNNRIHRVNQLLEALLGINDTDSIQQIIDTEEKHFAFDFQNTYTFSELGKFFRYKGSFLVSRGLFDEGMEAYLQSIMYFGKINDRDKILSCAVEINKHHCEFGKEHLGLLKRLNEVYNIVNIN